MTERDPAGSSVLLICCKQLLTQMNASVISWKKKQIIPCVSLTLTCPGVSPVNLRDVLLSSGLRRPLDVALDGGRGRKQETGPSRGSWCSS